MLKRHQLISAAPKNFPQQSSRAISIDGFPDRLGGSSDAQTMFHQIIRA